MYLRGEEMYNHNVYKKRIGNRIEKIRLNMNLNMEEFGKLMGASKGSVSQWESGKVIPNKTRLNKIAKYGDTTIENLLCEKLSDYLMDNKKYYMDFMGEMYQLNGYYDFVEYIRNNDDIDISGIKETELLNDIIESKMNEYLEISEKENINKFIKENNLQDKDYYEILDMYLDKQEEEYEKWSKNIYTIVLDDELLKEIELFSKNKKLDFSSALIELIVLGLQKQ